MNLSWNTDINLSTYGQLKPDSLKLSDTLVYLIYKQINEKQENKNINKNKQKTTTTKKTKPKQNIFFLSVGYPKYISTTKDDICCGNG